MTTDSQRNILQITVSNRQKDNLRVFANADGFHRTRNAQVVEGHYESISIGHPTSQ